MIVWSQAQSPIIPDGELTGDEQAFLSHCLINGDPLFVDENAGNYRLQPASPCIDAGISEGLALPELDLDNKPRIAGGKIDISAYEYQR